VRVGRRYRHGDGRGNRGGLRRCKIGGVGGTFHLADERLRGVLDIANDLSRLAGDFWELLGSEEEERCRGRDGHIGNGEHGGGFLPDAVQRHPSRDRDVVKIIYTRGNRTETLASIATLRKILNRFVAHRVFYEVSSRNKRGHEFFSAKNVFVVGQIEIVNRDYLTITIFDAKNAAHSIEILNPAAMRIYDDTPGKSFAVSFLSEGAGGVESRCYLRDEGEDGDEIKSRSELEKITLPQLFDYLEDITLVSTKTQ
jgi:hypothetical protein